MAFGEDAARPPEAGSALRAMTTVERHDPRMCLRLSRRAELLAPGLVVVVGKQVHVHLVGHRH